MIRLSGLEKEKTEKVKKRRGHDELMLIINVVLQLRDEVNGIHNSQIC